MMNKKTLTPSGEVDYRTKSGTAWSHNFLNQKPWHPLSYPNQRRKWIAEQTDAHRNRRAEEVAKEFAQEQEFFRQNALISKKEKDKIETMKAVSFMYVRPPGYNAESAKAAEIEDERRKLEQSNPSQYSATAAPPEIPPESFMPIEEVKKKPRPKDVFGRALPTEEEFEVLKNAPRLETGLPARPKPFGVEVRNVKCLRCGTFGHQSGDRECPLKDAVMPNEESRLKRDDPLTTILAQTESCEPLKWELKQKPGISPPRGGFKPDDPNQQIVAEDIFDEYGGFLGGENIPDLLTNFSVRKSRKHSKGKSKHKSQSLATDRNSKARLKNTSTSPVNSDADRKRSSRKKKIKDIHERRKQHRTYTSSSDNSDLDGSHKRKRTVNSDSDPSEDSDLDRSHRRNGKEYSASCSSESSDLNRRHKRNRRQHPDSFSADRHKRNRRRRSDSLSRERYKRSRRKPSDSVSPDRHKRSRTEPSDSVLPDHHKRNRRLHSDSVSPDRHKRNRTRHSDSVLPDRHKVSRRRHSRHSVSVSPNRHKVNRRQLSQSISPNHHKVNRRRHSVMVSPNRHSRNRRLHSVVVLP